MSLLLSKYVSDIVGGILENSSLKAGQYKKLVDLVYSTIVSFYPKAEKDKIIEYITKTINEKYDIVFVPKNQILIESNKKSIEYNPQLSCEYLIPELNDIQKKRKKIIEKLRVSKFANIEPGSEKWKTVKEELLSGTNMKIFFEDDYNDEPIVFLEKCKVYKHPINGINCYHGNKHEANAGNVYAHIRNVKLWFTPPLIQSEKNKLISATPDFICTDEPLIPNDNINMQKNSLVGRIVEAKCPKSRILKQSKDIRIVCPNYYYWQIAAQGFVTDLPECDFLQCVIKEYQENYFNYLGKDKSPYERFIIDTKPEDDGKSLETGLYKSVLIEMVKETELRNVSDNNINDITKFIHLPHFGYSNKQINDWIASQMEIIHTDKNILFTKGYVFYRIIYFRFEKIQIDLIQYDNTFEEKFKNMKIFWEKVLFFRNNKKLLTELKEYYSNISNNFKRNNKQTKKSFNEKINEMMKIHNLNKNSLKKSDKDEDDGESDGEEDEEEEDSDKEEEEEEEEEKETKEEDDEEEDEEEEDDEKEEKDKEEENQKETDKQEKEDDEK